MLKDKLTHYKHPALRLLGGRDKDAREAALYQAVWYLEWENSPLAEVAWFISSAGNRLIACQYLR